MMDERVKEFEQILHGVLRRAGIWKTNLYYDDYLQDLRIAVLQQLRAEPDLKAEQNPALFKWLHWRLRDLQRGYQRREARECAMTLAIEEAQVAGDEFGRSELYLTLAQLRTRLADDCQMVNLISDIMAFPDDALTQRAPRIGVSRATAYRMQGVLRGYLLNGNVE